MKRYRRTQPQCAFRDHDPSFGAVFERGKGASLWDVDGRRWIDLTCGFSATNFGHGYEPLVHIARRQLESLTHLTGEPHTQRILLSELLIRECWHSSETPAKVLFNSSGARAVETALKAAVSFRPGRIVSLAPSLHGRTIAISALSETVSTTISEAWRKDVHVVEPESYPYCSCCPLGLRYPECQLKCGSSLFDYIRENHDQVSAILVESVLTARGYVFPPHSFFAELRQKTRQHGIVLIADEVQSGMGRTAKYARSLTDGWLPDLLVFGKSLGGGMVPAAAVLGDARILGSIPSGAESETHAATPLSCAVAIGVVELLRDTPLFEQGCAVAESLRVCLQSLVAQTEIRVETQAAAIALEFATKDVSGSIDSQTVSTARQAARRAAEAFTEQLLRVHLSGPHLTRVVLLPPLTMSDEELELAQQRIRSAIQCLRL